MKHLTLLILFALAICGAQAQTITLNNHTRIELSGDTLILQKDASGNPSIGYHNATENKYVCLMFQYDTRRACWYVMRNYLRPFVRGVLYREVCIRTGLRSRDYLLNADQRDTLARWLNKEI